MYMVRDADTTINLKEQEKTGKKERGQ